MQTFLTCTVVDVTVGPVVVGVRRCGIKLEVGIVDVDDMVVVCSCKIMKYRISIKIQVVKLCSEI